MAIVSGILVHHGWISIVAFDTDFTFRPSGVIPAQRGRVLFTKIGIKMTKSDGVLLQRVKNQESGGSGSQTDTFSGKGMATISVVVALAFEADRSIVRSLIISLEVANLTILARKAGVAFGTFAFFNAE